MKCLPIRVGAFFYRYFFHITNIKNTLNKINPEKKYHNSFGFIWIDLYNINELSKQV